MNTYHPRHRQRGSGLIEPLIAIAVLGVGILGIARFQLGMVAQTTDSQARLAATTLADELASLVRVDHVRAACYTLPQKGGCAGAGAEQQAQAWKTRAEQTLPGFKSASAEITGNEFVVSLVWTSKAFSESRKLEVRTDVRP
ncbi:hypothetical protein [Hydrogenophaga taeniospiralis]|uniref:type IV pilus modification PilV family protein n=1 Tax=Hydrogenophaga taeniospiralis TaxID=65656 RepID=UPI001CFB3EE9|nr:hypothetical protein [Hydrogenophaga taeniospiralis]UCU92279.1 hypothetical protein KI616_15570 [Hydrogenophaga taeniospiralis]